jgi:hypothetical protein
LYVDYEGLSVAHDYDDDNRVKRHDLQETKKYKLPTSCHLFFACTVGDDIHDVDEYYCFHALLEITLSRAVFIMVGIQCSTTLSF